MGCATMPVQSGNTRTVLPEPALPAPTIAIPAMLPGVASPATAALTSEALLQGGAFLSQGTTREIRRWPPGVPWGAIPAIQRQFVFCVLAITT